MKKLASVFLICCIMVIAVFLLFANIEKWVEFNLKSASSLFTYALLSFTLLVSDIVLPIPSSLIMLLNGKILGIFFGTLNSTLASTLSSAIGFYLGRKSNVYLDKFFNAKEKEIGNRLFQKWGNPVILFSKALPIVSEAVSFVSGTTAITLKVFLGYSLAGNLIVSTVYAAIGKLSTSLNSNGIAAIIIGSTLIAGWISQKWVSRKATHQSL
jgi:uncharacterized membrane protein YdjX (TVP38/TMEM64 family)